MSLGMLLEIVSSFQTAFMVIERDDEAMSDVVRRTVKRRPKATDK